MGSGNHTPMVERHQTRADQAVALARHRAQSRRRIRACASDDSSPSIENADDEQHERDDQQYVDERADCVRAHDAKQPRDQQNDRQCVQHRRLHSSLFTVRNCLAALH